MPKLPRQSQVWARAFGPGSGGISRRISRSGSARKRSAATRSLQLLDDAPLDQILDLTCGGWDGEPRIGVVAPVPKPVSGWHLHLSVQQPLDQDLDVQATSAVDCNHGQRPTQLPKLGKGIQGTLKAQPRDRALSISFCCPENRCDRHEDVAIWVCLVLRLTLFCT